MGRAARSFLLLRPFAGRVYGEGKRRSTVAAVEALVTPALAQLGLRLWDVRFEKKGRTGSCAC